MIELFRKYVKWKVLAHFLANPNTGFHIKQLARLLGVSPASVSGAVKSFEEDGLLSKEEKGLAHIYMLNPDNNMVAPLKKAYGIAFVLSSKPKEVSISVFKLSEWRAMAKKGDAFYKRVIESHILLQGSGLK